MTTAKKAGKLLDPKTLNLPSSPKVVRIEVEDYVDSGGDDALRVYVIIRDGTRDEELTGESGLQMKRAIRERLQQHDVPLFPYVMYRTESQRRDELADLRA
jgi:hypothetical protein